MPAKSRGAAKLGKLRGLPLAAKVRRELRWYRRAAPVLVSTAVGLALGGVLFWLVIDRERAQIASEHGRMAQAQIAALEQQVSASLHVLSALQGLAEFDSDLEPIEFRAFYQVMVERQQPRTAVRLVEWLREVPARELSEYEARMRKRLADPKFQVWQPHWGQGRRRASGRPRYHVVELIEPAEEHGTVLGLDSGHSEATQQGIWQARRTGRIAATAGFRLAQDGPGRVSVIVYAPVCAGARWKAAGARCEEPLGFAAVGLSVQALLDKARVPAARSEFGVRIYDEGIRGDEWVLLAEREGRPGGETSWMRVEAAPVEAVIQVADRRWHVVCSGTYPLPWGRTWPAWALLATSLLITAAVQTLIVHLERQNRLVRQEVKKRTRQLRRAMRLARQGAEAKSQFLAKVSHEIRTPLNGIIGMTQLLLDSGLSEEQRESMKLIVSASRHLLTVVNDTLDLSKIEAGKLALQQEPFALRALLGECDAIFRPAAEQKGLELRVEAGAGLPEWVLGDVTRLRQVVWNLLSNAVKFTERGVVELRVMAAAAPKVRFEVRDTGPGIGREDREKLFEPYFQSKRPGRQAEGTGLGLAISRRLVELMGGEMGCESAVGEGSVFWFEAPLPACESPAAAPAAAAAAARAGEGTEVLLAEDNEVNQKVVARLLERLGCRVSVVQDGLEAVEAAARGHYDVIFMDCQMPRMDGYEAAQRIREMGGAAGQTPIVALTAHAMASDRARCLEAGMSDYVTKPVSLESLREALERAAAGRPAAARQ
jgi:signal transduction histidine kinase/CheY-like chemotaxis protein